MAMCDFGVLGAPKVLRKEFSIHSLRNFCLPLSVHFLVHSLAGLLAFDGSAQKWFPKAHSDPVCTDPVQNFLNLWLQGNRASWALRNSRRRKRWKTNGEKMVDFWCRFFHGLVPIFHGLRRFFTVCKGHKRWKKKHLVIDELFHG